MCGVELQIALMGFIAILKVMTITLPDDPALLDLTEADIRLDLACALFAAGRISRPIAARLAGLDLHGLDRELFQRKISVFSEHTIDEDLASLETLFPA